MRHAIYIYINIYILRHRMYMHRAKENRFIPLHCISSTSYTPSHLFFWTTPDSSGVCICKSIVNYLRHGKPIQTQFSADFCTYFCVVLWPSRGILVWTRWTAIRSPQRPEAHGCPPCRRMPLMTTAIATATRQIPSDFHMKFPCLKSFTIDLHM